MAAMASLRLDLRDDGVDGDLSSAVAERIIRAARALAAPPWRGRAKEGSFAGPSNASVLDGGGSRSPAIAPRCSRRRRR